MYVINIILVVSNIFSLTIDPFNISIPTQEVVDLNNVVPFTGTPYVVNTMYALIVEPTLMGPRIMPPWHIVIFPYMVGYLFFALVVVHTVFALPTDFLLDNNGGLPNFFGYMGNV
jgi:hypothetical protein